MSTNWMKPDERPSVIASTLVVAMLTALWAVVRLILFRDTALPLTFVVPLIVCVWSRRRWQLWSMVAAFTVVAVAKASWVLPGYVLSEQERWSFLGVTVFNILAGGVVVHLLIASREKLDERNARLAAQNVELEIQGGELSHQNGEINAQAEELAEQNEEIESQAEELATQNEELHETNERLRHREEILQGLLESSRSPESGRKALGDVCQRALRIMGRPVDCIAILKLDGGGLRLKVYALEGGAASLPDQWPIEGSIAGLVLQQDKTAYISDLGKQPELAAPFAENNRACSILATPVRVAGAHYGVLMARSAPAGHWTEEQFRMIEWLAAQCGLIAEALRWQRALAARADEIEAANRAKDQFFAMLSHELRTPLTPVLAAAGSLEHDERIPQDIRDDLQMIRRNVAIQSRLIDDLLDVTRLGRGKFELVSEFLDVAKLLRETAAIVVADLDAKNQTLALDLHAAEGCTVYGDGPRLQQVFWNLLKNAIKFSPANGRIEIRARLAPGPERRIAVEVSDSGIGIQADNMERIFRPFEQIVESGKQRGNEGGLGLGLTIAKAIVELHQGRINVASEGLGKGATFTVELPLVTAPVTTPAKESPVHPRSVKPGANGAALRILLVEDHDDTSRILARLLRAAGYEVECSDTAASAYERFKSSEFNLVISDLGLPGENGNSLMRRLRELRPGLAGICLSGYGMEEDLRACREAGFAEHLTKPVDIQRLHAAIARVCNGNGS